MNTTDEPLDVDALMFAPLEIDSIPVVMLPEVEPPDTEDPFADLFDGE